MLDEWRKQLKKDDSDSNKRPKVNQETKQKSQFVTEGTTALERYRMRKQQKLQQQLMNEEHQRPPQHPSRQVLLMDDEDDNTADFSRSSNSIPMGTPSFSRRMTNSGKARRRSFSVNSSHRVRSPLTQDSEREFQSMQCSVFF